MGLLDVERARLGWWAIGGFLAATLLFVLYSFVGTFVFGIFIYYATRPVYRRIRRRVTSRSLAAALALFALALPALVLLLYAVAIGLQELGHFANTADLGPLESVIRPYLDLSSIVRDPSDLLQNPSVRTTLQSALSSVLDSLGFVGTGLLHVFVMFALAFYLLRDGPRLSRWVRARFGDDRDVLTAYGRAVDRDLSKVFSGNILNAVMTGAIGAISYSVLDVFAPAGSAGIPYAALVGLLAGVASLVPVVGMKLVYVPVAAYLFAAAYISGGDAQLWFPATFVVVSFVVVDTIPDLVLRPYVSGRNLHVGMVMFAYIFGPLLFGWYGIFLGPVVLVFMVHFARIVLPELLAGRPIQPYVVDPTHLTDGPPSAPDDPAAGMADEPPTGTDGGTPE
ncbi:MAG: AI-2E family transporter [Haloarculaceae archaeon]